MFLNYCKVCFYEVIQYLGGIFSFENALNLFYRKDLGHGDVLFD